MRARNIANFFVAALALAVVWFLVSPLFVDRQDPPAEEPASGHSRDPTEP